MQEILDKIVMNILDLYHSDLNDYFRGNEGKLITSDVVVLILNITSNVSTNLYYSLKEYINEEIDYDFIRAKMINELSSSFEDIKNYNVSREVSQVTPDQVKEILQNGHVMIKLKNGKERKITRERLMMKKDDYDQYIQSIDKKDTIN